jgi:IclR family transcriptional regulator, mhp operon transcriptional activator
VTGVVLVWQIKSLRRSVEAKLAAEVLSGQRTCQEKHLFLLDTTGKYCAQIQYRPRESAVLHGQDSGGLRKAPAGKQKSVIRGTRSLPRVQASAHDNAVGSKRSHSRDRECTMQMRGVLRTLEVLRTLGRLKRATVLELSRETGISRGSLYRILETLRESAYVTIDLSLTRYCLTDVVLELSQGFTEEDKIVNAARPALRILQREIPWPIDLATFARNAMYPRETTRTVPIDQDLIIANFPMLCTATGRTYLAWCTEDEREAILRAQLATGDSCPPALRDPHRFQRLLQEIRDRGYGVRYGEVPYESGAISVPIVAQGRILGCVTISFPRRNLSVDQVVDRYVQRMIGAANDIVQSANLTQKVSRPYNPGPRK